MTVEKSPTIEEWAARALKAEAEVERLTKQVSDLQWDLEFRMAESEADGWGRQETW